MTSFGKPGKIDFEKRAIEILRENEWGGYTLPTKGLYPYQWNWDSMFVALGFAEIDLDRAWTEVESLFAGQWDNGMAAHIVFRRKHSTYFPGPDVWCAGKTVPTSGHSQPPVAATVVRELYEKDPAFGAPRLKVLFPKLMSWHRWFHTMRVISGGGAIAVTHPWESGRDNSPDWDQALANVDPTGVSNYVRKDIDHVDPSMRPTKADYDRYIRLVEYGRGTGWDHAQITRVGPFAVADPGITFILMRADCDLRYLAEKVGVAGAILEIDSWATKIHEAADYLWSETLDAYVARDLRTNKHAVGVSSVAFLSFYAGFVDERRDRRVLRTLRRFLDKVGFGVPSFDPTHALFDPRRYWRGPSWAIINYLIARGLQERGYSVEARRIRGDTRAMIEKSGFFEYFNPLDGSGAGGDNFTWTAAIWLAWASPMVDG